VQTCETNDRTEFMRLSGQLDIRPELAKHLYDECMLRRLRRRADKAEWLMRFLPFMAQIERHIDTIAYRKASANE